MNESPRRPLTTKIHLYHALYLFNRGFLTLAELKRLEEPGMFRHENLSDYEVRLELTRSDANEELTSVLQGLEEDDAVLWDERHREREKRPADPDDVFLPPATANRRSRSRSDSLRPSWRGSTLNDGAQNEGIGVNRKGRKGRKGHKEQLAAVNI